MSMDTQEQKGRVPGGLLRGTMWGLVIAAPAWVLVAWGIWRVARALGDW